MRSRHPLALAALIAVAGCGEPSGESRAAPGSRPSVAESRVSKTPEVKASLQLADGTTVGIDGDPPEIVGDIGYGGTLTTVDGGCWAFDDGIGTTTVFFLVDGATLTDDGLGVVTDGGVELRVGDEVYGGGCSLRPGSAVELAWRAARPERFEGRRAGAYIGLKKVGPVVD